jgi:hypothetical protein
MGAVAWRSVRYRCVHHLTLSSGPAFQRLNAALSPRTRGSSTGNPAAATKTRYAERGMLAVTCSTARDSRRKGRSPGVGKFRILTPLLR